MSNSKFDLLNNRGDFKLYAAKIHLEKLKEWEDKSPDKNLARTGAFRLEAEMEIDEILYYLVGVKDALLQEINSELQFRLDPKIVTLDTINGRINQMRTDARDLTKEICSMVSDKNNQLWVINELHNHAKHRNMIGMAIVFSTTLRKPSLLNPNTGDSTRDDKGNAIPIIEYLTLRLKDIEDLQKTVRAKIEKYREHPK